MTSTQNGRVVLPESVPRTPSLIAAAKLQVTIDRRRGVETDPIIRELARSQPNTVED